MKPQNLLHANLDASVLAKELGVSGRQVRKARRGKSNSATEMLEAMSPQERGDTFAKLREVQEAKDNALAEHRAPRRKNRYF